MVCHQLGGKQIVHHGGFATVGHQLGGQLQQLLALQLSSIMEDLLQ
jgi:hypothetical protein